VPLDPDVALFLRLAGQRLTFPAGARNDPQFAGAAIEPGTGR
jgi:hypothetical protein